MEEILKRFPPDAAQVIRILLSCEYEEMVIRTEGADLVIEILGMELCACTLTLKDVEGWNGDEEELRLCERRLERDGEWFVLHGLDEDEVPVELRFRDAEARLEVFRAGIEDVESTPWELLRSMARNILDKGEFCESCLNVRERALLPLLGELATLSHLSIFTEWNRCEGFPVLRGLLVRNGYRELLPLVERIEAAFKNVKKRHRRIQRLLAKLDQAKYEPLWREIYDRIVASQEEYPVRSEMPERLREEIGQLLAAQGYGGTYPDFVKTGSIRGLRLEESYEHPYMIVGEKRAVFYIHCTERFCDGEPEVWFQCGTELLRDGETPGDLHSCRFNAKGRRFFHTVDFRPEQGDDLELKVTVAAKKAELRKLSKRERRADMDLHWLPLCLGIFLIGGGCFAVTMTVGMLVVCGLLTWVFAGFERISEILTAAPWLELFGFCWLGFGGVMGLVTVWAKRD